MFEVTGSFIITWSEWSCTEDILGAIQWGTVSGIAIVLFNDSLKRKLKMIEKEIVREFQSDLR